MKGEWGTRGGCRRVSDVWGHFINVVVFSASGTPDDNLCNFDEVGAYIAVLVE